MPTILIKETIEKGFVVIIPSSDGKSCGIGDFDVKNDDVCSFLLSLGVSMYEETGKDYALDIDESTIYGLENDDVRDVGVCKFKEVKPH